jgi:hypothetical protein
VSPGRAKPVSTSRALATPLAAAGLGIAAAALLHVRDPHDAGSYGICPFLAVTGVPCPGCGGLRAVNDLTRGDVVGAVSSNALVVVMVAATAVLWCGWVVRRAGGDHRARPLVVTTRGGLVALAVVVGFWVLRITPWGAWLAP